MYYLYNNEIKAQVQKKKRRKIARALEICDYNPKILNVNANFPGSVHDSFIWRHSIIQQLLRNIYLQGNRNTWLVGNSGYPQQPWLMTPILHANEGTPEFRYTERQIQARNCIERCFGVLKGRFRCLLKERVFTGLITNVCAILHNICVEAQIPNNFQVPHENNILFANNDDVQNEGQIARQNLIRNYSDE
ncbi:hypothetical protein MML48_9g00016288 [Holotrichia oblita]|uniref:Uncharacterized protein n=1 Tax=Holotrichia oblita TaxID=644536 RepID=A0ACB9SJW0_HOLOL|nr:hypothetical protein MML48_9g00016288 [Holotrichia oblita]